MTENQIRDELATRLDLLEPGLVLVDTNYKLINVHGSDGYIDLLARDRSSSFVIIELKRADQSAREALHEIGKYADLLSRDKGVPTHKVRAMIVSTAWRELLVPYSYFVHHTDFSLEGFELTLIEDSAVPGSARYVDPIEMPDERSLTEFQGRIEISAGVSVSTTWGRLTEALTNIGAPDHAAISITDGSQHQLIVSLGAAIDGGRRAELLESIEADGIWTADDLEDHLEDPIEELLFMRLHGVLPGIVADYCYPDKVGSLLYSHGWFADATFRAGIFQDTSLFSDKSILDDMDGASAGLTDSRFNAVARPFNKPQWQTFLRGLHRVITVQHEWRPIVDQWVAEVATKAGRTDVGAHIYDYGDLLQSLVHGLDSDPYEFMPTLAIAVQDPRAAIGVVGSLAWDGTPVDVRAALTSVYPNAAAWTDARQFGSERETDALLLKAWHLRYVVWEKSAAASEAVALTIENGQLAREPIRTDGFGRKILGDRLPITDFLETYRSEISRAVFKLRKTLVVDPTSGTQMHMLNMSEQAAWTW